MLMMSKKKHFLVFVQNDWVISRVFQKTSGGKKVHISGLMRMNSEGNELAPSALPPLMDPSPYGGRTKPGESGSGHVHCFSNTINLAAPQKFQEDFVTCFNNPIHTSSSNPLDSFSTGSAFPWGQFAPIQAGMGFQFPGPVPLQDPSILRTFLANYGQKMNHGFRQQKDMVSVSQETVLSTENSSVVSNLEMRKKPFEEQEVPVGPQDLDCIWSY